MKESKLLSQLKLLDKTEFKRFYLYLRSPYFTHSKDVIKLFLIIRKYYPSFLSPHLNKEIVFKKLFPNQKYSDIKLRNLRYKLSKIVENYLIQISYEQDDFEKRKRLTQIYGQRNHYSAFKRGVEELLADLEATNYRDSTYFFEKYILLRDLYFHEETHQLSKNLPSLEETLNELTNFYAIERLYLGIDLKNRERIFSEKHHFNFESYSFVPPLKNTTYQLLHYAYQMLDSGNKADYLTLKRLLFKEVEVTRKEIAETIFYLLLNFAHQQLKTAAKFFLAEIFELYEIGIHKKILTINDTLYLNFISVGLALKKFEWARGFMENYERDNEYPISDSMLQLTKGDLYFNEGIYEKVIEVLKDFQSNQILFLLRAKHLIFRSLYKLTEKDSSYFSTTIFYAEAFERFLKRSTKLNPKKKQGYLNFIQLIRKIFKHREHGKSLNKDTLAQIAGDTTNISGYLWLEQNL